MKKNQRKNLAIIIGIIGLIVMFVFPSPQENFGYYVGFVVIVVLVIVWLLKWKK